jgi:ribosomal protein S18 acetylase RimI-like enzyme
MQIRGFYRPGDYEAMHRLDLLCFAPEFQFDLATMRQVAEAESAIVVIAEHGPRHEMAGFVILHLEGSGVRKYAYIVTLDVAPEARRSGVATLMLTHAEEQARAAGARRVALHVAVENTAAIQFYEHQKYLRAGLARGFYREAGLDALVYAKHFDRKGTRGA